MFVGAMCAVGTLNVNAFGFPALNARSRCSSSPRCGWRSTMSTAARRTTRWCASSTRCCSLCCRCWLALQLDRAAILPRPQGRRHHLLLRQPVLQRQPDAGQPKPRPMEAAAGDVAVLRRLGGAIANALHAGTAARRTGAFAMRWPPARRPSLRRLIGILSFVSLYMYEHPQPSLPVLHPQTGVWLPGLPALSPAVRRHGRRHRCRHPAALRAPQQPRRAGDNNRCTPCRLCGHWFWHFRGHRYRNGSALEPHPARRVRRRN
jgi:hypothetical protein